MTHKPLAGPAGGGPETPGVIPETGIRPLKRKTGPLARTPEAFDTQQGLLTTGQGLILNFRGLFHRNDLKNRRADGGIVGAQASGSALRCPVDSCAKHRDAY